VITRWSVLLLGDQVFEESRSAWSAGFLQDKSTRACRNLIRVGKQCLARLRLWTMATCTKPCPEGAAASTVPTLYEISDTARVIYLKKNLPDHAIEISKTWSPSSQHTPRIVITSAWLLAEGRIRRYRRAVEGSAPVQSAER